MGEAEEKPTPTVTNAINRLRLNGSNPKNVIVVVVASIFVLFCVILPNLHHAGIKDPITITGSETKGLRTTSALALPQGKAVALPSIRLPEEESTKIGRDIYGGKGDKVHLGGFTDIDLHGISPALWKDMVLYYGVKSLLDVGCGRGISTTWFLTHGVDAVCVEGSHDARQKTMLPDPDKQMVEHDFSRGPWWPEKTYDAVWCVEFLEHVGRNFHKNYLPTFRKAALLFVTHSTWGGWHHVEVHTNDWWINKFESYGFRYSERLTQRVKKVAQAEASGKIKAPNGEEYNAQHIWLNMLVFINPEVAALPEHAHIFSEPGCYEGGSGEDMVHRPCSAEKKESPLPDEYGALTLTPEMDKEWEEIVKKNIPKPAST